MNVTHAHRTQSDVIGSFLKKSDALQAHVLRRLEVHVSYDCVNRCLFCGEYFQLKKIKDKFIARKQFAALLTSFAQLGCRHVTLTGGEPTLHPDLPGLLQEAKGRGYTTFVTTNGGRLGQEEFSARALPWLDEICFSLHGHTANLHNMHTQNGESFDNVTQAMKRLEEWKGATTGYLNVVVTRHNIGHLKDIIAHVSSFKKIRQILFSNLAPEGRGLVHYRDLHVPLIQIKRRLGTLVKAASQHHIQLRFFGVPVCVLAPHLETSNDLWWSPRATVEKTNNKGLAGLKTTLSRTPTRRRMQTRVCAACAARALCGGVFKRYRPFLGKKELNPL